MTATTKEYGSASKKVYRKNYGRRAWDLMSQVRKKGVNLSAFLKRLKKG